MNRTHLAPASSRGRSLRPGVALLFLSLAAPAHAADWTVGPGQSIQAAIDAASDGDRILVQPGTYNEVMSLRGKRLEVIGVEGFEQTIIDGSGLNNTIFALTSGEPTGTRIAGFTLTRGAGLPLPSSYGFDYYGGAVHVGSGSQLRIEDCLITENALSTGTFAGGIYSGGRSATLVPSHVDVVRCEISHNRAWASGGATLVDGYGTMSFDRCTVVGNDSNNFFGHQGGISMANHGRVWVKNTICWGNAGSQIGAFAYPYNQGTEATVTYCDIQGGYSGQGVIDADPLFVDYAGRDYRIQAGSPCIDAGDPATDLDCDGTIADMGGYGPDCDGLPDCNGNGVPDVADIASGSSADCDEDGVPDECQIAGDPGLDQNVNGVLDSCECVIETYCVAAANSTGQPAAIGASGSTSLNANDLTLSVSGAPPLQVGLFFYGADEDFAIFGDGNLCVAAPFARIVPVITIDGTGSASVLLDLSDDPFTVGVNTVAAFETWRFQFWYRDPNAGMAGFNFSDALAVTFCP